jgi:ubiquinone/menaquinone biosynthesis C-methylase UbiE
MGLYSRVLFPWLCDLLLDQAWLAEQRQRLLVGADGRILEIGFGTGLNLPYYPTHVHQITAVDPNPGMSKRARRRSAQTGIAVEQHTVSGEHLPFAQGEFDCIVSTLTLCSIEDVRQALAEVYRVLRPGGRFLFLEHGLSPDRAVQKWQHRLNWLEQRLADGCRLDRNIRGLVTEQPFASVELDEFYLPPLPRTHGYMYRGMALKGKAG